MFQEADALAIEAYQLTASLPDAERFGLQSQLRRSAVSVAANIVEGCARQSTADYCRFLEIARASSCECAYLAGLGVRLNLLPEGARDLTRRFEGLSAALLATMKGVRQFSSSGL